MIEMIAQTWRLDLDMLHFTFSYHILSLCIFTCVYWIFGLLSSPLKSGLRGPKAW